MKINKAPVIATMFREQLGLVRVLLSYRGRVYEGLAQLDPRDQDFFSERVGTNIAKSRAKIKALQDEYKEALLEAKYKNQMWKEVTHDGDYQLLDPTGHFMRNATKADRKVVKLREALIEEKNYLKKYLEGQEKAIESVKRLRAQQKQAENN